MSIHQLFTIAGSGGMIVESAFAIADVPVKVIDIGWDELGWESKKLIQYNPLGQVPTLILPDGQVMTESAAIMLHLADLKPDCGLVPGPDKTERPAFLRWLIFIVSAIYPTFTYGDVPKRWVNGDESAASKLVKSTDEHREFLYRHIEQHAGDPWFLGDVFSCIDIYFLVMCYWRPKNEWFERECPKLSAIGQRVATLPAVKQVTLRNFGD